MKLATLRTPEGTTAAVAVPGGYLALEAPDVSALLASGALPTTLPGGDLIEEGQAQLLNPLPAPRKVICCGLNYAEHILEMGRSLPRFPTLFAKYADTLTGPTDSVTVAESDSVDWEAELAVVVGAELRNAGEDQARQAIAGYAAANDVSMRDWQNRTLQWFQGKAWDRTTPLGPVLVTADEVDPEDGLEVVCRINGQEVQRGNTRSLVFSPAALLSYISTFTVLRPGDVVLTGTPGGVGMGMTPPRFLADGDVVTVDVAGIGRLENRFFISPTPNQEASAPRRTA